MFKSQNKMTCIEREETLHHFWNFEKSRSSLWKMISSKFFAAFFYKSISRNEPLAYHGPLFKRKDPLRLGLFTVKSVMFVACWKTKPCPTPVIECRCRNHTCFLHNFDGLIGYLQEFNKKSYNNHSLLNMARQSKNENILKSIKFTLEHWHLRNSLM